MHDSQLADENPAFALREKKKASESIRVQKTFSSYLEEGILITESQYGI